MSTNRISFEIKVNIHVLSKSTGVVVSVRSCIAKTLQNCIGLQKNIFGPVGTECVVSENMHNSPSSWKVFWFKLPLPLSHPIVNSTLASYFPLEMMGIAAILTCTQTLYFVLSSLRETTNKSINHRGFEKTLGNTWGCSRGKTKIETSPSPLKFPMTFSKVGMDVFWNCTTYSKDNITITFNYYSLY